MQDHEAALRMYPNDGVLPSHPNNEARAYICVQDGLISIIPCWIWPGWVSIGCKRKHCDEMRKMHYLCMVRHNTSSQWQNMRIMIPNHWQLDCLFNSLLGLTLKWMSKFHLNILLWGETMVPGEKGPKNEEGISVTLYHHKTCWQWGGVSIAIDLNETYGI